MRRSSAAVVLLLTLFAAAPALAQRGRSAPRVSPDTLRARLFALANDSMGGRDTGSPGNAKAADWVAALFQRYGLEPAGDNGSWFQTIPFFRLAPDTSSFLTVSGAELRTGRDLVPVATVSWNADGTTAVYGGILGDSTTWPAAGAASGKLVVFMPPGAIGDLRLIFATFGVNRRNPRFAGAVGFALAAVDALPADLLDQIMQGRITSDTNAQLGSAPILLASTSAATALLGTSPGSATAGQAGPAISGAVRYGRLPLQYPARNVVGILRGSDRALRNSYVSVTAHNDHVGFTRSPVDHDSVRAFNTVVRPMGADSRMRPPTAEEAARITALRDSLRRAHPARQDSIFNGADDDGTGTVALLELARVLSGGPRPKRSILFVSHAAEERGLLGSQWYTDHATVPVDSIVAEIDEDMIGRGNAADLPEGGPGYLEVIGAKRLSPEFGDTLEAVSARQRIPFQFNYAYDAPGHPLQYYCRADHYSYARYGIPSVALSRGEHMDYHQVTDEPQYIDYDVLARVAQLVADASRVIANMDHRPLVTGPKGDPHAPCRQ